MMEKEMADTEARQEKVDHKLKERIGKFRTFPTTFCAYMLLLLKHKS